MVTSKFSPKVKSILEYDIFSPKIKLISKHEKNQFSLQKFKYEKNKYKTK